jgi:hypothetical protein
VNSFLTLAFVPRVHSIPCVLGSQRTHFFFMFRCGDGKTFPRNPRSDETLARLAKELVQADKAR